MFTNGRLMIVAIEFYL